MAARLLDPAERASEVLFGLVMVLTFTGSISVAEAGREEIRTVLVAAIGCNLAWGVVDAAMYLMARFTERARATLIVRAASDPRSAREADELVSAALPEVIADALTPDDVALLRHRLREGAAAAGTRGMLGRGDVLAAGAVFLVVVLSTFPVVVPFLVMRSAGPAVRVAHTIATVMLFAAGWSLGRHVDRSGWRVGAVVALGGLLLAGLTMALGG